MREERWIFGSSGTDADDFDEWTRADEDEMAGQVREWRDSLASQTQAERPFASWSTRDIGRAGESIAAGYLMQRGYDVVELNYRCPAGEADIVARDGEDLVLVEVKTRVGARDEASMPELAVDEAKQTRYMKIAAFYQSRIMRDVIIRFDVIAINLLGRSHMHLHHLIGAFGDEL